jgi:hypothetical protein
MPNWLQQSHSRGRVYMSRQYVWDKNDQNHQNPLIFKNLIYISNIPIDIPLNKTNIYVIIYYKL